MEYDALIGELYDVCHEYEDQMNEENEQDIDFLTRLYALNFEVRKNGVKGIGISEVEEREEDVRIAFDQVITALANFSDECCFSSVCLHLENIRAELLSDGIDGLKPH